MADVDQYLKALQKARDFTKSAPLSFRFKADWDQVARFAKEAYVGLRRAGAKYQDQYFEALALAGQGHENTNLFNQSGMDREELADAQAKLPNANTNTVVETYKQAARMFQLNSQIERCAEVLMRAARFAEEKKSTDISCDLMNSACSAFEGEDRAAHCENTFKACVNNSIKMGDYPLAISYLQRATAAFLKRMDMFSEDVNKNSLSEIILLLAMNKLDEAKNALAKHENSMQYSFSGTDAAIAATDLITTIERSPSEFESTKKKHSILKYIDVGVARLIQKLDATKITGAGRLANTSSSSLSTSSSSSATTSASGDVDDRKESEGIDLS